MKSCFHSEEDMKKFILWGVPWYRHIILWLGQRKVQYWQSYGLCGWVSMPLHTSKLHSRQNWSLSIYQIAGPLEHTL